jgi:uncharacterized protein YyaL (SSP411 family)
MSLVNALDDFLAAGPIVIVRGDAEPVAEWSAELGKAYAPNRMVFAIPRNAADLPAAIAAKRPMDATVAYVCSGMTCSAPLTDIRALTHPVRADSVR